MSDPNYPPKGRSPGAEKHAVYGAIFLIIVIAIGGFAYFYGDKRASVSERLNSSPAPVQAPAR